MAKIDRTLPDKLREAVLKEASARNLPVEINILGRAEPVPLKSRFLAYSDTGEPVIIEVPTVRGQSAVVHAGETFEVLLMVHGQRYGFHAKVIRRGHMNLGEGVSVATLSLEYPWKTMKLQRRRFFRVETPRSTPLPVRCIAQPPAGSKKTVGRKKLVKFDTVAVDISSGGMRIEVPRRHVELAKVGRRMALLFRLSGFAEPIKLVAEVRHTYQRDKKLPLVAGMQFIDWHKTLTGRRTINSITRYVVKRQRDELKKKSGLE